jgi:FtsH Extracellular
MASTRPACRLPWKGAEVVALPPAERSLVARIWQVLDPLARREDWEVTPRRIHALVLLDDRYELAPSPYWRGAGKGRGKAMKKRSRMVIGGALGALLLLALFNLFSVPTTSTRRPSVIDYSSFVADVDGGKIVEVTFRGSGGIAARRKDGQLFESYVPHVQVIPALTDRLLAKGVTVSARPSDEDVPSAISILASWLPLILFNGLLYFAFARPLLAIARQVEVLVRAMQEQSSPRPPPTSSA